MHTVSCFHSCIGLVMLGLKTLTTICLLLFAQTPARPMSDGRSMAEHPEEWGTVDLSGAAGIRVRWRKDDLDTSMRSENNERL